MPKRRARKSRGVKSRRAHYRKTKIRKVLETIRSKIYPTTLQKSIIQHKKRLLSETIQATTQPRKNRFSPMIAKREIRADTTRCREKKRLADQHRRRLFFRAKGRGSTTSRPEHERRHIKC